MIWGWHGAAVYNTHLRPTLEPKKHAMHCIAALSGQVWSSFPAFSSYSWSVSPKLWGLSWAVQVHLLHLKQRRQGKGWPGLKTFQDVSALDNDTVPQFFRIRMGWCPYSCFQRCQEALRKQQHENWRSKALLREAWLTAYQQYSRWQHVATTTTYSAVSGSFFSTCVFLIVLCNFWGHFGIIWGRNWPVQFVLGIHWCGYQTHWAVYSSIENGGNYVSWKYL